MIGFAKSCEFPIAGKAKFKLKKVSRRASRAVPMHRDRTPGRFAPADTLVLRASVWRARALAPLSYQRKIIRPQKAVPNGEGHALRLRLESQKRRHTLRHSWPMLRVKKRLQ